jgi:competence protein ComEA
MMQRIIVIALAILISLPVIIKSRARGINPAPAAFSVFSTGVRLIQISGDVRYPGLYPIGANVLTDTAIKMAVPDRSFKRLSTAGSKDRLLTQGEHLQLALRKDGFGTVTVGTISSNERMILGIPLDINGMSASDFELLPGIGPVVAQRIIEYRQKNGGKIAIEDLQAVEGIGDKKYNAIIMYFQLPD